MVDYLLATIVVIVVLLQLLLHNYIVRICPEDGTINHSCFEEPQDFVYKVMEKRFVMSFHHS